MYAYTLYNMSKSLNGSSGNGIFDNVTVENLLPNDVVSTDYQSVLNTIPNGLAGTVLTANAVGPPTFRAATFTNTDNIVGGTSFSVPYQSAPSLTLFSSPSPGVFLSNGSSAPAFSNSPSLANLTLTSTTANTISSFDSSKKLTSIVTGSVGTVLTANSSGPPSFNIIPNPNVSMATGILSSAHGGTGDSSSLSSSQVFIAPSGIIPGPATWRSLTNTDLPVIDLSTSQVTGVLPLADGGTGSGTFAQSAIVIGPASGSGAPTRRTIGASDISAVNSTSIVGDIAVANGGTGVSTVAKNTVFSGDSSTNGLPPAFRLLENSDLPQIDVGTSQVTGLLGISNGGSGAASFSQSSFLIGPSTGSGTPTLRTIDANDISSVNPGAINGVVSIIRGGTGASSVSQNIVFAGPNGSTGPPLFRSLVIADIPTLDLGTGSISGITPLTKGGVGDSSLWTAGQLLIGNNFGGTTVRQLISTDIPSLGAGTISSGILAAAVGGTAVGTGVYPALKSVFCGGASTDPSSTLPSWKLLTNEFLPQINLNASPAQVVNTLQTSNGGTGITSATANLVFAAPVNGSLVGITGPPVFRTIYDADITSIAASKIISGTVAVAVGGTGVSTTSQNSFFAGPISGAGAPSFRTIDNTDVPWASVSFTPTLVRVSGGSITSITYTTQSAAYQIMNHCVFLRGTLSFSIVVGGGPGGVQGGIVMPIQALSDNFSEAYDVGNDAVVRLKRNPSNTTYLIVKSDLANYNITNGSYSFNWAFVMGY